MKFSGVILALMASYASAFMPTGGRTRGLTNIKMGYVPDGLTPAQYKAIQAKEAAQVKANKKKMKGSVEDLTDWQARAEKQNPNQPGAGHVYVKLKGKATYGADKEGYGSRFGRNKSGGQKLR